MDIRGEKTKRNLSPCVHVENMSFEESIERATKWIEEAITKEVQEKRKEIRKRCKKSNGSMNVDENSNPVQRSRVY